MFEANQNSFRVSIMSEQCCWLAWKIPKKCEAQKDANRLLSLRHNINIHFKSHYTVIHSGISHHHLSPLFVLSPSIHWAQKHRRDIQTNRKSTKHKRTKRDRTRQPERSHCACRWHVNDTRRISLETCSENFLHLITEKGRKFYATSRWLFVISLSDLGSSQIKWTFDWNEN